MTELSDNEREQLAPIMQARKLDGEHRGYLLAGATEATPQCIVANTVQATSGDVSVCGAKSVLIEELRRFKATNGDYKEITCVVAAVLEITDSPIHFHAETLEYYSILSGSGKMILGTGDQERVVNVQTGSLALLAPGQPHGIVSDDPNTPVRAILTFTPGLAPKDHPDFRDEQIVHNRTSKRLQEITSE